MALHGGFACGLFSDTACESILCHFPMFDLVVARLLSPQNGRNVAADSCLV
jgi:hypothetical protein